MERKLYFRNYYYHIYLNDFGNIDQRFKKGDCLLNYCKYDNDTLEELGIKDNIINLIMKKANAHNKDFFLYIESYVLLKLLDPYELENIADTLIKN